MPKPPAASTQPLSAGNRAAGNHSTKALKLAIKQADTPADQTSPHDQLQRAVADREQAGAGRREQQQRRSTRRGPNRSSSMPSGS